MHPIRRRPAIAHVPAQLRDSLRQIFRQRTLDPPARNGVKRGPLSQWRIGAGDVWEESIHLHRLHGKSWEREHIGRRVLQLRDQGILAHDHLVSPADGDVLERALVELHMMVIPGRPLDIFSF